MSNADYRKALIELRQTLLKAQETGEEAEQTVELDQTRVGRLSRMDAMQAQAMSKETGRRRRQKLIQIEAALRRIDNEEYGYCEETGEPISLKRLDARPIATLSLEAQERHERAEKVHRDD